MEAKKKQIIEDLTIAGFIIQEVTVEGAESIITFKDAKRDENQK
jgi:hypothetical protein